MSRQRFEDGDRIGEERSQTLNDKTFQIGRRNAREGQAPARSNLLTGMLFDADEQPMTPTHAVKKGVR